MFTLATGPGTSGDPCSENYRGRYPFSEPETAAMARKIWSIRKNLVLYMTLHSYGQYWLTPWGFTYEVPDDFNEMVRCWCIHVVPGDGMILAYSIWIELGGPWGGYDIGLLHGDPYTGIWGL